MKGEIWMATIVLRKTDERITGEGDVTNFLDEQGVLYEHWDTNKLPESLREQFILSAEDKEKILEAFDTDIRSLSQRHNYKNWDIVALSPATPNLDELLLKFQQVHVHTEDEVRAITAGNGIFTIKGNKDTGYFDVVLEPGDVISVPVNTPHFFTLVENRRVVAVRLFTDAAAWVAHPYEDPEF
jgi:1,2-dihydroxy-3-keto-5-methylthiopentene dioxygenase